MKRLIVFIVIGLALATMSLIINSADVKALDETKCLACHGNPELSKNNEAGNEVSLFVSEQRVNTSAHRFIDCTTCHTEEPHKVQTPLTKLSLAEKCGSCHKYESKLHLDSVHGRQLTQGNQDVATCVDCHSSEGNPHSVVRVLEYNATAYKKNIADTCAKCHDNEQLMSNYGIVERVYESYMRSFHGKAIQLGTYESTQLDEATCINCHGFHDIKSTADPTSPVAGLNNLANTCEECHEGAGARFASGFLGHKEASSQHQAPVHYTDILFRVVLTTVLVFGFLVVIAALVRFTLNKWRE